MKAYVFPGQGSQFIGMEKYIYENLKHYKRFHNIINEILGLDIMKVLFTNNQAILKTTKITQLAIYIYSILKIKNSKSFVPDMVAGHSLGEIAALVAAEVIDVEHGLQLVYQRALAMHKICININSGMAAILGLENNIVENICKNIIGHVVPANYNCPKQIVISGEIQALKEACKNCKKQGAKVVLLPVTGAFHSPLMATACTILANFLNNINFKIPKIAFYQNVTSDKTYDIVKIKHNISQQVITPVNWTKLIEKMIADGATEFIEVGPGNILQGLIKKINKKIQISNLEY